MKTGGGHFAGQKRKARGADTPRAYNIRAGQSHAASSDELPSNSREANITVESVQRSSG
jgi:hypothetical protein